MDYATKRARGRVIAVRLSRLLAREGSLGESTALQGVQNSVVIWPIMTRSRLGPPASVVARTRISKNFLVDGKFTCVVPHALQVEPVLGNETVRVPRRVPDSESLNSTTVGRSPPLALAYLNSKPHVPHELSATCDHSIAEFLHPKSTNPSPE